LLKAYWEKEGERDDDEDFTVSNEWYHELKDKIDKYLANA
jgi:hypothetical protein